MITRHCWSCMENIPVEPKIGWWHLSEKPGVGLCFKCWREYHRYEKDEYGEVIHPLTLSKSGIKNLAETERRHKVLKQGEV